ncbi:hypothetical protein UFOVP838_40 [uncultured Caudovirales phage]|uniref:Uncharacterized protein n=1 Tax=uncultured Caudovirales phage TaxID=2100421 RepID=A0A6J5Q019_9CAUD|nr:hypothetical protein UFOVP838_40 [uncultured Caudovirales phage]CAB4171759.1 hypothetical protein UFOVP932_27 [uncultured Caudovirales phage]CAB4177593.1 hypothetical protein UFOVP1010_15 [uncultured Caudovirales phage]CAB4201875.1 hypothetical protein UFOVP1359_3 [uncultured Caudovirales phage]
MDIVDKLKDSYAFLGDPLHRQAWEEIEQLRADVELLMFMLGIGEVNDNPTDANDTDGHPERSS